MPTKNTLIDMDCLSGPYVESLLEDYLQDPSRVGPRWRQYFQQLLGQEGSEVRAAGAGPGGRLADFQRPSPGVAADGQEPMELQMAVLQERVDQLIRSYRVRGHLEAQVDPLGRPRPDHPELDLEFHDLTEAELDRPFSTTSIGGPASQTLRDIIQRLRNTYCRLIGVQFMHIDDLDIRDWLQQRMEETENRLELGRDEQIRILTRLTDAVMFEQFLRKKFVGAKTFSLEGAETLIPLLHLAIEKAGDQGLQEIVMAMAHRGRLNVLVNILEKSPQEIFWEFEDANPELQGNGQGDVKYHLGYSSDWITSAGHKVHLSLCFNPSHLEFVNPVAAGRVRAKQDRYCDHGRQCGMGLIIHGDASFAGQGIVQEMFNLSQLPAYTIGGTLHVIVNNQIGFTTAPEEGRSSTYATDVARMLQIPIFHVNGEDPEAVSLVVRLAMDFRHKFHRDVVIDMYCYRRLGHNESDEPSFTQPVMYGQIKRRPSIRDAYLQRLLKLGQVTDEDADRIARQRREHLEEALRLARQNPTASRPSMLAGIWKGYYGGCEPSDDEVETGVERSRLAHYLQRLTELPDDFHLHRKLGRGMDERRAMARGEQPVDWATAEALAFASILDQGHRVRLSGQDTVRGTFSQRHATLFDTEDGHPYSPLQHVAPDQAPFEVINTPLSELGVLGFEYGYSLDCPEGLVLWEAQFGDFCNAAQVIIDQFLASAEDKWRRLSGLVLLLPHGFEGQGPEHASARLERFLTLAAEDNLQIAWPSTAAQYFHCLRRQLLRRWRKPLVLLTPKSLLRNPAVASPLEDLASGRFRRVLPDRHDQQDPTINRVLLCGGKICYELLKRRQQRDRSDIAIVRLEQFYPLPVSQLRLALEIYPDEVPVYWVQEEPENMGAWRFLRTRLAPNGRLLGRCPFAGITRPESASPATGSATLHKREQKELIDRAFGEF